MDVSTAAHVQWTDPPCGRVYVGTGQTTGHDENTMPPLQHGLQRHKIFRRFFFSVNITDNNKHKGCGYSYGCELMKK